MPDVDLRLRWGNIIEAELRGQSWYQPRHIPSVEIILDLVARFCQRVMWAHHGVEPPDLPRDTDKITAAGLISEEALEMAKKTLVGAYNKIHKFTADENSDLLPQALHH